MATIPLTQVVGPYHPEDAALATQFTTITFSTPEATGDNVSIAQDVLLLFNNPSGAAVAVTVQSGRDPYGRVGEITAFQVPATSLVARRFRAVGWEQQLGSAVLFFTASVELGVAAIPV